MLDTLIDGLPRGTTQYYRAEDGSWSVGVFEFGATNLLVRVATGMDKNVALWLQTKLRQTRGELGAKH